MRTPKQNYFRLHGTGGGGCGFQLYVVRPPFGSRSLIAMMIGLFITSPKMQNAANLSNQRLPGLAARFQVYTCS